VPRRVDYEDRITIDTPEGVALELTLAGLGSRAIAGGIDVLLKLALAGCELLVLIALFGEAGWLVAVPVAGLSLLVYNVAFETLGGGRPPGKRLTGLRVVRASGAHVDFRASMIRNVVRLVDGLTFSYLPTMVSILVTPRNQRLGDLAAGTVVIRERRGVDRVEPAPARAAPAPGDPAAAGATWDVSAVPAADVATVRAFLERRDGLAADARARLASQLDGALRPRVGGADERDSERFLEILYDAKRARG
jgi:uncharacterized RDD family membrane protein YckC